MQALKQFSLPIKGLKIGFHNYSYNLDSLFFAEFDQSPINSSNLNVKLEVEKKSDHLALVLEFSGTVSTECNRCTDDIDYPLAFTTDILVKYDVNEREEEEIIYIHPDAPEFNCAKFIYDMVILAIPMTTTCDDVPHKDCNPEIIARLYQGNDQEDLDQEIKNPLSEALKNLKLN